jgi:acetyltransferase-like isoleucine patch superfamily enzyme
MFSLVEQYNGRSYSPSLRIGDGTVICRSAWFSCVGEIEIGADVLIGPNVLIADSFHEYADRSRPINAQPMAPPRAVRIGSGSVIGPGAAILSGTQVGTGSYVAAGAVVAGEYPSHTVLAGNPAEVIRSWDEDHGRFVDTSDPRFRALLGSLGAPQMGDSI